MEKELQLVFTTDQNKKKIITVANPREDVTLDEAQAAMQVLIEQAVFENAAGELSEIAEARMHTCTTSELL
ncbi:MAG: DUF2922 domain-containing protein [Phascolarctobacterium sp.]|uniref:DUF2922 domain-containing protein n=1 Tax=Phascolarctobacterium sp. TaxID=2049039 RepID=UPI0026DAC849|nr:DUF2922 domain-containing protein [Phascolarctobacterium sp.]MDO4921911.1 DUF2922 domain-containing protein [Phascolarctobacterium sp.]